MSQEPKRRHSKARKGKRRAAIILKKVGLISCKNCGKSTLSHIVCKECGYYQGKDTKAGKQSLPTGKVKITTA